MIKPALPKGFRDFGPEQMARRKYMINIITEVFEQFAFQQIETPAVENMTTLTGKGGDESDKLLFRILNSGDYFEKYKGSIAEYIDQWVELNKEVLLDLYDNYFGEYFDESRYVELKKDIKGGDIDYSDEFVNYIKNRRATREDVKEILTPPEKVERIKQSIGRRVIFESRSSSLNSSIAEKGMHYDLTVPLARFVVMNQNDISFPFRRYQVQPVWRADRPQKGRYREFYQCDADILGSDSLVNEVELIQIFAQVFEKLDLKVSIRVNNRKLLQAIAEIAGIEERVADMTMTIDKMDKIGREGIVKELEKRGFEDRSIKIIESLVFTENEDSLLDQLSTTEIGQNGVAELNELKAYMSELGIDNVVYDYTLARGLDYYTGTIFEVMSDEVKIGTIASGGRYDNLTGLFGLNGISGVGISFGLDRIYDVINELNRFPNALSHSCDVMLVNFGGDAAKHAFGLLQQLRAEGLKAELYPDDAKLKKQMKYADSKGAHYTIFVGTEEMAKGEYKLKDMHSGNEFMLGLDAIIEHIKKND